MAPTKTEKELLAKINDQEEQLIRYKKRLQDVVAAHKKLISEKERLEETLKTVSCSIGSPPDKDLKPDGRDSNEEIIELKARITKLAQSLSSLIEEKTQMEAKFQTDRKQLIQQNSELQDKLKTLSTSIANSKKKQEVEVESVKSQLNMENNQRELDFSSNIRELQKIITDERRKREEKESTIEKLRGQLKEVLEKLNESRDSELNLQSQLSDVRKQLDNENAPLVIMEKLKRELQIMKEQHSYAVHQEQTRALKAEDRARRLAIEHESRVSKLEQKLAQLSDLASNYDKYRQDDQQTIMKLKNRLMQLELENSNIKCEDDRAPVSEETLIQQLQHIKHQLIISCKTANQLNNLKEILMDGLEVASQDDKNYKLQYMQLKQQFEEYTKKVHKNQTGDDVIGSTSTSKHKIHNLKAKILELESFVKKLQEELEIQHEQTAELIEKERQVWKSKMNAMESEYRNRSIVMEQELEKQRERVSAIVDEKEKELVNLQQHYFPVYQFSEDAASTDAKKFNRGNNRRQSSTLLYYLEDVARKDAEINRLRKQNNELQVKIHNIEKEYFQQMQLYAQLQQDIHRLEKQHDGTEELNTKYLKNVFFNYLVTIDPKMRSHMLNAIFAILKFTDLEMNRVLKLKQQN